MSQQYTDLSYTNFPDSVDSIERFNDVSAEMVPLVNSFYACYDSRDLAGAAKILNDNPGLKSMIINAEALNKLRDPLIAMQRFYLSDVQQYILDIGDSVSDLVDTKKTEIEQVAEDSKQDMLDVKDAYEQEINARSAELTTRIDNFTCKNDYLATLSYKRGNTVRYNGNFYMCVQDAPVGETPAKNGDTAYWSLVITKGEKGADGASGTGLAFCGLYSTTRSYAVNDCVSYNNILWAAVKSNTNSIPSDTSTDWVVALDVQAVDLGAASIDDITWDEYLPAGVS